VYRSDAEPVVSEPAPATSASEDVPRSAPASVSPAPVSSDRADTPRSSGVTDWIEASLYMMTVPIAVTFGMMVMPMMWMFGPDSRR
jgi:hypothetical protein